MQALSCLTLLQHLQPPSATRQATRVTSAGVRRKSNLLLSSLRIDEALEQVVHSGH